MPCRPRVVLIHSSDELYGADRMVLQVARAMKENLDVELEVWLPDDAEHAEYPLCELLSDQGIAWRHTTIPVLRRSSINLKGLIQLGRNGWALGRLMRAEPVDLVYCATSACLIAAPIARLCGVRRVVLHIQELWSGVEARVLRMLARCTTAQVAISAAVAQAARGFGINPTVVENCVEEPPASETTHTGSFPRPAYVVASRWNSWKGHGTLAGAWSRAGCPGHLTILGGPPRSGAAVDVPDLFARTSIDEASVTIVGEVAEPSPYISAADALVLPSDAPEPFGLVVIEAFAAGRPVIASRAGGPLEIITDQVDGWFYEPGNEEDLADLLRRLTIVDLERAGVCARATYERRYAPTSFRTRIVALIADELDGWNTPRTWFGTSRRPNPHVPTTPTDDPAPHPSFDARPERAR